LIDEVAGTITIGIGQRGVHALAAVVCIKRAGIIVVAIHRRTGADTVGTYLIVDGGGVAVIATAPRFAIAAPA
jgi:hypothetical protein